MSYPVSSLRIRLKCAAQINLGSKKKISRGNFPRLIFSCPVPSGLPHRSHCVPMNMNPYGFRLLSGSGRRIRTLTYGVRVRCATITQSRYIALFAALCRSANKCYYSRNFAFVNRKFSKKSKFGKFLSLPHFPVTSRWRTNAAAARTRGAGRCAWPTPPP